jgi:small conductance mechanosensitive channel
LAREPSVLPPVSQWDDRFDASVKTLVVKLADLLPRLVAALLVLLAFFALHRSVQRLLRRILSSGRYDLLAADILRKLVKYAVLGLGFLMAAAQLGFNVVSMLAGLGVAGLAVGLAAKDTLANFIAGLILLWDRPFLLGEDVEVAGIEGFVRRIELRTTRIETLDGNDVIIPNGDVVSRRIVNYTGSPRVRVHVPVGIAYGSDLESARRALLRLVAGDPRILAEPQPSVQLMELGSASIRMELRFWTNAPRLRFEVQSQYLEKAALALKEAGVKFPAGPQEVMLLEKAEK